MNLVLTGFNSGWEKVMGPESRASISNHDFVNLPNSHYSDPVFSWKRPVAPTAITFFNSKMLGDQYDNNIFVGDFLNGNIYYFELNATRTGLNLDSGNMRGGLSDGVVDSNDEL